VNKQTNHINIQLNKIQARLLAGIIQGYYKKLPEEGLTYQDKILRNIANRLIKE